MASVPSSDSPFERVSKLIEAALNPEGTHESRTAALRGIAELDAGFLRLLSMDGDWRFILSIFANDPIAGDYPGDGAWTSGSEWEGDEHRAHTQPTPASGLAPRPLIHLYCDDIQRMLTDDLVTPFVTPRRLRLGAGMAQRMEAARKAVASEVSPSQSFVRRLAWSVLDVGGALQAFATESAEEEDILSAYIDEVTRCHAHLGVPRRFAETMHALVAHRPAERDWLYAANEATETRAAQRMVDCMLQEAIEAVYLELRLQVATSARMAEIANPRVIACAELYCAIRILKQAGALDLRRVHAETLREGGSGVDLMNRYQMMEIQYENLFARAIPAVYSQPMTSNVGRLAERERSALMYAQAIQSLDPSISRSGLLQTLPS
jgi:hypothetical protein